MKFYLTALKPFLIIAILRLISSMVGPVLIILQVRFNESELFLDNLPHIRLGSTIIGLVSVFLIIWVGYRISKNIYPSIWLSATAGISYFVFSFVLAFFIVCLTPLIQASLSALILWIPFEVNASPPFHALKGFFTVETLRDLLLYSGYGLTGGVVHLVQKSRKMKRQRASDAQATEERNANPTK